uniref:ILEI/PANDER domain-containing protein n=1 Tax=Parascaris univalens TaxID=6257 RepID=A0A915CIH6_PARUN
MPRVSTFRRLGIVVLSVVSIYLVTRTFIFLSKDDRASRPFHAVRSKFIADAEDANIVATVGECPMDSSCRLPRLFLWMSTESRFTPPIVCVNGIRIFEEAELVEGFNVAVLSENGRSTKIMRRVPRVRGDQQLIELLAQISTPQRLVLMSYGDVADKLSAEARQSLNVFGASSLSKYGMGKSLLFVGQFGLPSGKAEEKITDLSLAKATIYSMCVDTLPREQLLNSTHEIQPAEWIDNSFLPELSDARGYRMEVQIGRELRNCGVPHNCRQGEIPMSFYTGTDKNDSPSLCVNGHFYMDRGVNGAGRGLNLVVIDAKTHQVLRCGHFDTYAEDSTELVMFLEQLLPDEIVAVVSFDEASTRLSDLARQIFYELGSSFIQNLKFRSSWYFIGQKGIDGYSAFEDLTMPSGNDWAKAINKKICVPSNLSGLKAKDLSKTAVSMQNSARRHFCGRYDGYEDFCADERLEEVLTPRSLSDDSRMLHAIFSVPILVVGGLNMNNIRLCLESLYEQEGINPRNVVVASDAAYPEVIELSTLFRVRSMSVNTSSSYNDLLMKSLSQMISSFPSAPCFIVIEEDILLAPDFLFFLDQLLSTFLKDSSVNAILTWNKNGFMKSSSIPSAVYRMENIQLSGAFLLKRIAYEKFIVDNEDICCSANISGGWRIPGYAYVPDVSRVRINAPSAIDSIDESRRKLFAEPMRYTNNETLANVERLYVDLYDADLKQLIDSSAHLTPSSLADCRSESFPGLLIKKLGMKDRQPLSIFYTDERENASLLARCFHLVSDENGQIFCTYKGVT